MNDILQKLTEPFGNEAVQRTDGKQTKKGYDTTGYCHQCGREF